jgi:hypothetical protein
VLVLTFTLLTWCSPVYAQSTQEMLRMCKDILESKINVEGTLTFKTSFKSGVCWGSFGTFQGLSRFAIGGEGRKKYLKICAPSKSTLTQFIKIFEAYAEKNPQKLHEDWDLIALTALWQAFPCK